MLNRVGHPVRHATLRHYLMCPPTYFDVTYSINPWMDPSGQVDRARAMRQWSGLVDAYRSTGHRVDLLEPLADLPDMVYAANGATVSTLSDGPNPRHVSVNADGTSVYVSRFITPPLPGEG